MVGIWVVVLWLVRLRLGSSVPGAVHLALVGRRGADTSEAADTLDELTRLGAQVSVHAADVTDLDAMRHVVDTVDHTGHPVRGVVHAAMVLNDMPLAEATKDTFEAVLAPKALGVLVLDEVLGDRPLDFFVSYSSGTTLVGNVHQANYGAGNLFLEAFTRARRACAKPATVIAWGAIDQVGYVVRHNLGEHLRKADFHSMGVDRALDLLEDVLAEPETDVTVSAQADWSRASSWLPMMDSPRPGRAVACPGAWQ